MSKTVAEIAQEAEATTAQAEGLMERIARQELREALSARGLHPENLTDEQLDQVAEGIASGEVEGLKAADGAVSLVYDARDRRAISAALAVLRRYPAAVIEAVRDGRA
jgi:hypothetical protein